MAPVAGLGTTADLQTDDLDKEGHDLKSKSEFLQLLRRWHDTTSEETIGEVSPGVQPWIFIEAGPHVVRVHADTKRSAICRYLALADQSGGDLPWRVTKGARGTLNKVCIEANGKPTEGFFLYTTIELLEETTL